MAHYRRSAARPAQRLDVIFDWFDELNRLVP